jgi:cysteine desulfurase
VKRDGVIYLDYASTTPVDRRVLEAIHPVLKQQFGNPASTTHRFGIRARETVEASRQEIASFLNVSPGEVVFTSGATESNNLALKGFCAGLGDRQPVSIVSQPTEHLAILDPLESLKKAGHNVQNAKITHSGLLDLENLRFILANMKPGLVSIMAANNETGVLLQVLEVAMMCREFGWLFHCDASQIAGKLPFSCEEFDAVSVSGHKIYAPKGVGVLVVRKTARKLLWPLLEGGGQERGLRSGTLNVPGIAGLGVACRLAGQHLRNESRRIVKLREKLERKLREHISDAIVHGDDAPRLPGICNIAFPGVDSESLICAAKVLAFSTGSACTSGSLHVSHVLTSMGVPTSLAMSSVRLSLGRMTTSRQVEIAADVLADCVETLRRLRRQNNK